MEDSKLISMVSYFRVSYDVGYNFGAYENYNDEVFYEIITNFQRNNNLKFLEEEISEIKRKVENRSEKNALADASEFQSGKKSIKRKI
jgi:hypothetical protein